MGENPYAAVHPCFRRTCFRTCRHQPTHRPWYHLRETVWLVRGDAFNGSGGSEVVVPIYYSREKAGGLAS
jgi:hypothetical protein